MVKTPVTRVHLECLTTDELIKMAEDLGLDIPQGLDRIFIIEELLDDLFEDDEEYDNAPELDMLDLTLLESVPLPKQYNITFLEVIVRDPMWAYVFWEIKAQDKELFEKSPDFEGYYLKASLWKSAAEKSADKANMDPVQIKDEADGLFRVLVQPEDNAWYLGFNPAMKDGLPQKGQCQFKVELCLVLKDEETVLAVSKPFSLPEIYEASPGNQDSRPNINPLGSLSGYRDFHILRNSERLSRIKKENKTVPHEQ